MMLIEKIRFHARRKGQIIRNFISLLMVVIVTLAISSCGGGGGGGGDPGFTGVQTLAVIDDTSAEQLVVDAYTGGSMSDQFVIPLAVGGGHNQALAPIGKVLFNSLPVLDFAPTVTPLAPTATPLATTVDTVNGTCGGTATATVTDNGNSVSGSIAYANYCDAGVTLNGNVSFSASLNVNTDVVSLSMSFSSLGTVDESLSGSVSMTFNLVDPNAPMTISMNIVLTDALNGNTFWIENYTLTITPAGTVDTVQFSGTYHDFDAGHVIITTTSQLLVDNLTEVPVSGTLHFAGGAGTFADLTFTGGGGYTLTVSTGTVINGVLL